MIRFWPLLFIAIPLIEIYLFIEVGSRLGGFNTVLLVVLTAVVGVNLLRYQGFTTLRRAQQNMQQGQMPAQEMLEGMVLAVGGVLLITPGFLTDALGLFCLLPFTRRWLLRSLFAGARVQMHSAFQAGQRQNPSSNPNPQDKPPPQPDAVNKGHTIEGEYRRDD